MHVLIRDRILQAYAAVRQQKGTGLESGFCSLLVGSPSPLWTWRYSKTKWSPYYRVAEETPWVLLGDLIAKINLGLKADIIQKEGFTTSLERPQISYLSECGRSNTSPKKTKVADLASAFSELCPKSRQGCHISLLFWRAVKSQVFPGTCDPGLWRRQLLISLCTGVGLQFLPGTWLAICRLRAAAAAAWGAEMGWEGPGAPCFTVFVANIVLSAPWGMILLADVDTEGKKKNSVRE